MARSLREYYEDAIYHVMVRGVRGLAIFGTDVLKQRILANLKASASESAALIHAYCVMSNHLHLLIQISKVALGVVLKPVIGEFAQLYNYERDERGHVVQDRFKSKTCKDDAYLLTVARYIEHNPVRAGMVGRPEDYAWSSCRAYLGSPDGLTTTTLLKSFFTGRRSVEAAYAAFIGAKAPAVWPHRDIEEWDEPNEILEVQPVDVAGVLVPPGLASIAANISSIHGLQIETLIGPSRKAEHVQARIALMKAASESGFSGCQIAKLLQRSPQLVNRVLSKVSMGSDPIETISP